MPAGGLRPHASSLQEGVRHLTSLQFARRFNRKAVMRLVSAVVAIVALPVIASAECPAKWSAIQGPMATAAHVRELRRCLNEIIRWRDETGYSTCRRQWKREGDYEDTFPVPECARRVWFEVQSTVDYPVEFWLYSYTPADDWQILRRRTLYEQRAYRAYLNLGNATHLSLGFNGDARWLLRSDNGR